jgi:hypothetical protein
MFNDCKALTTIYVSAKKILQTTVLVKNCDILAYTLIYNTSHRRTFNADDKIDTQIKVWNKEGRCNH